MAAFNSFVRWLFLLFLLIAFSVLATWIALTPSFNKWFIVLPVLGIFSTLYRLIKLFNLVPSKIAYFFNAIENEDSMLHFPEKISHKPTADMNRSLNRINLLIQDAKRRNREQDQYYSLLLEQAATGIVVINANGSVMQANSAAKKLLHYQTFNHIEQLKRVDEHLYQAFSLLREGRTHQFVKLLHEGGITHLSLQATSFSSHDNTLRIISVQDISNELDAQEIESWMKLIRVLTHEIMNSITPITSLSQTLLSYYTASEDKEISEKKIAGTIKGLEVINERGQGLIHFVESYRKLSKLSPPDLKEIELKTLLDHLLLLFENEPHFDQIAFSVQVVPEDLVICADEVQISQVFINLIKNAMAAVEAVSAPKIAISGRRREDGRCDIVIADNGIGIPQEMMDQIFIPFFTTKENGSGIGLSLSRQIMKNHSGSIEVSSSAGLTQFTLSL